jgi:DNA polymerase-1
LVIEDTETKEIVDYADQPGLRPIAEGLARLSAADEIIGHNVIKFDIPALKKVYPGFAPRARVLDTLVLTRLLYPELKKDDAKLRIRLPSFPGNLVGSHKLEAFGHRLRLMKGEFKGPWEVWTPVMHDYCIQDVRVNSALFGKIRIRWQGYSQECIDLEMAVAQIVARQERRGVSFDEQGAAALYAQLAGKRTELEAQLKETFHPWIARDGKGEFTPKRDNRKMGYTAGHSFTKVKLVEFNPKSRDHIASRLTALHGWKPVEFTPDGKPKVDDTVMSKLKYPEAPMLTQYLMVQKRIGQLAEGTEGWLKHSKNGVIRGGVNTCGAITRRMTHMAPNLSATPTVEKPYGPECRGLFRARSGYRLLGCDADSLEGRCLAGYMAPLDGGAYIQVLLSGDAKLGTDTHSTNARALGMDPKAMCVVDGEHMSGRAIAKRWLYAYLYGAGDEKLGWIMGKRGDPSNPAHWAINRAGVRVDAYARKYGKRSRTDFTKGLPALGELISQVQKKVKMRGYIRSIDKGQLPIRSPHSALNTLLQSAGAIFMKKALVLLDTELQSTHGLAPGEEYEFVLNIHDEWQIEVRPQHVELVASEAKRSITKAGEHWNFPCPLVGNSVVGNTWAETH